MCVLFTNNLLPSDTVPLSKLRLRGPNLKNTNQTIIKIKAKEIAQGLWIAKKEKNAFVQQELMIIRRCNKVNKKK